MPSPVANDEDAPELIQIPAPAEVVAKREAAARKAGLDPAFMPSLAFDFVPVAAPPKAEAAETATGGIYRAATTRPISDIEHDQIKHLIPDAPGAKTSTRAMIDAALRFVVAGESWSQIGHGRRWPAVREKVRREREYRRDRWTDVLRASDLFDDLVFRAQFQRVARWVRDGDMRELAAGGHRRIRSREALAAENVKRRVTIERNSFEGLP